MTGFLLEWRNYQDPRLSMLEWLRHAYGFWIGTMHLMAFKASSAGRIPFFGSECTVKQYNDKGLNERTEVFHLCPLDSEEYPFLRWIRFTNCRQLSVCFAVTLATFSDRRDRTCSHCGGSNLPSKAGAFCPEVIIDCRGQKRNDEVSCMTN